MRQMNAESGGRQFQANGQPLVGHYRDGSMPPPALRAYGAGQMQIGTAQATAARLGIPFDQNRFMNDRDYNLSLANAHMDYLRQRYGGDQTLALAAYHSGEGNVDRAVRDHGRANFVQGLGPEGRAYVQGLTN